MLRLRNLVSALALLSLLAGLLTGLSLTPAHAGAGYEKPKTGQCRNLSGAQARAKTNSTKPRNCASRHTAVTVGVGKLSAGQAKSSKAKVKAAQTSKCQKVFNKYVGRSAAKRAKSAFALRIFSPTKAQKKKGARWFRCDAVLVRGSSLTPITTSKKPLLAKSTPRSQALCETSGGSATTCDATHSYKATHAFKLKGKKYPGTKKVKKAARKGCKARVDTSNFRYDKPSKKKWAAGTKYVVCFSYDVPPVIRVTSAPSVRPSDDLVVSGYAADQDAITSVLVQLRRSNGDYLQDNLSTFDPTPNNLPATAVSVSGLGKSKATFSVDVGPRPVNSYSVRVLATDRSGNVGDLYSIVTVSTVAPGPGSVRYEMNEASGATVMVDSGGTGLNGTINQAGLDTGIVYLGATGYQWPFRSPTAPPASPERVVQVPDSSLLDARGDTFSVEVRYRTSNSFGNIIQKGQSTSLGGQWKIQAPGGKPSCLFKSSPGTTQQIAVQATKDLSNNQWHTVRCVRSANNVKIYIDGAYNAQKTAPSNKFVGNIDNSIPLTIGGKSNCNNTTVGCDYFSGHIDYVRITHN